MIGLIVDGVGDLAAMKARYSATMKILKSDGPRGHTVSEQALANAAKKQVAMLKALGCRKIAILTDFEGRSPPSATWCKRATVHVKAISGVDVVVLVADQMIENWFLADIAHLSSKKTYLKAVKKQKSYESTHGKKHLKSLFKPGYNYSEIKHGAELFPLVRAEEARKFSQSLSTFLSAIEA